jgi:hypothetical protein
MQSKLLIAGSSSITSILAFISGPFLYTLKNNPYLMYWFYYTCFGSDKCNHIVKSRYREKLCALLMEMWQTLKLCRYGGSPYTIAPPEMGGAIKKL